MPALHRFKIYDSFLGEMVVPPGKRTAERIEEIRGTVIPGTAEEVDDAAPSLPADASIMLNDVAAMVGKTVVGGAVEVNPVLGGVAATMVPGILNMVQVAVAAELAKL